jgi:hypothetical protein
VQAAKRRRGIPQLAHPHVLAMGGLEALRALLPGFEQEVRAALTVEGFCFLLFILPCVQSQVLKSHPAPSCSGRDDAARPCSQPSGFANLKRCLHNGLFAYVPPPCSLLPVCSWCVVEVCRLTWPKTYAGTTLEPTTSVLTARSRCLLAFHAGTSAYCSLLVQVPLPVTLGAGRFRPHQLLQLLLLLSAAFPGAQSVGASRALIQSTLQDEVMRRNAGKLTVMDGCRVSGLLWDEEKTRVKGECAACLNLLLVLVLVLL